MKILYLSYTGLLEPLGRSQIFAYLKKLSKVHKYVVVSFEKPVDLANRQAVAALKAECAECGIDWRPLRYHRRPRLLATSYDIAIFMAVVGRLIATGNFDLMHARSYIPALVARLGNGLSGIPFIYDMRGFWPDERVNSGSVDKNSKLYRILKYGEYRCLISANAVISLTHAAVAEMRRDEQLSKLNYYVIPTCANLSQFAPNPRTSELHTDVASPAFVLGCIGTVASNWFRLDWVMRLFLAVSEQRSGCILRFVTRDSASVVEGVAAQYGIPLDSIELYSRPHEDMPSEIRAMDAGVFFYRSAHSELARCPTRMAEFLGCGVPCVVNPGIGDVEKIAEGYDVGVVLRRDDDLAFSRAADDLFRLATDPHVAQRCRSAAEREFSLEFGVEAYKAVYAESVNAG